MKMSCCLLNYQSYDGTHLYVSISPVRIETFVIQPILEKHKNLIFSVSSDGTETI
jgi:hypothetical protein